MADPEMNLCDTSSPAGPYAEVNEFLKFDDTIDFAMLDGAFEDSPIYTANIEHGFERSTTYVAKIDEHDESAG